MKYKNPILRSASWIVLLAATLWTSGCEEKPFSDDYDINWPKAVITSFSSESALVDEIITVSGENLDKVTQVTMNGKNCPIVEGSLQPGELKFRIARRAASGTVMIENIYRRITESEQIIEVSYPEILVTGWPTKITKGEPFSIKGENVDLITEVNVGTQTILITNPSKTTEITVPTNSLNLIIGELVNIKVRGLGVLSVSEIQGVEVVAPSDIPETYKAPIVLWDFESGDPVTEVLGGSPVFGRNLNNVKKARGNNFFSVMVPQTGGWSNFLYMKYDYTVDLGEFRDPHITMLVNTNGKTGYINPFMSQGGSQKDNHLNDGTANERMKYGDDYKVKTNGWEWRSYPVRKLFPDFDAKGVFDNVWMRFTSGNVGNSGAAEDFEIHVDQIMITDGLFYPAYKIWDFEDGTEPVWDGDGSTHGINALPASTWNGSKYFSVSKPAVGSWNWFGAIANESDFDLSALIDPYINIAINTGSKKGFVQLELGQGDSKFGASTNTSDYFFNTQGNWIYVSMRINSANFGKWGGTLDEIDSKGVLSYVKVGFTTGNINGEDFEINIDDVYLSDGPMW